MSVNAASVERSPRSLVVTHSRIWLAAAAALMALTAIGFAPFYLRGNGFEPASMFGAALAAIRFGQERRIVWWLTGGLALIVLVYPSAWWAGGTQGWAAIVKHGLGVPIS